jgi:hypothetical protein
MGRLKLAPKCRREIPPDRINDPIIEDRVNSDFRNRRLVGNKILKGIWVRRL